MLALSPIEAQSQPNPADICRGPSGDPTSVYTLRQELVCNGAYRPSDVAELKAGAVHCDDPIKLVRLSSVPYGYAPIITKETAASQHVPGCVTTYEPITIRFGRPLNSVIRILAS